MNKKLIRLLFCIAIFFIGSAVNAQSVSGNITEAGMPLPGVNISVKGTSNGTASDFDGNYSLNEVNSGDTLVFSFIGYETQEIVFNGQSPLNVVMTEDAAALDEVVDNMDYINPKDIEDISVLKDAAAAAIYGSRAANGVVLIKTSRCKYRLARRISSIWNCRRLRRITFWWWRKLILFWVFQLL